LTTCGVPKVAMTAGASPAGPDGPSRSHQRQVVHCI
jgi:hypothetical protein